MDAKQMWADFGGRGEPDAWAFGEDPDLLASLTREEIKTATSSAFAVYEAENEPLPKEGDYSVVLGGKGEAVCVIRTTAVRVVPFDKVSAEHARKEGEGDLSLAYWRKVHEAFFRKELASIGQTFSPDMPVVCEEFEKVWP
ncbi:MAG: ASCH domain-containing protein [Acutalibacteraceae bacterium]|jgi:uncharacterized protein YhfF